MQDEVKSSDEAWRAYRILRSDRRIGYLAEPHDLPETWQAFTQGPLSSPNLWTDAYLCAFANSAGVTLLTFDAKIPARPDVNSLILRGSS
jgi:predicted nucleic acid-binding protein